MLNVGANRTRRWSSLQDDIFIEFRDGDRHIIVRARAGTGKTTTIVEAVLQYLEAHPQKSVIVCAFNKRIADELVKRFTGYPVTVKTLHAIGYALVLKHWPGVQVSFSTDRARDLTDRVTSETVPDAIKKLISNLHTKGREIAPHAAQISDLTDIAIRFECDPDKEHSDCQRCYLPREDHDDASDHAYVGYDLTYVIQKALDAMELAANERPVAIDGSDMIFLPVRLGLLRKMWDIAVVDEAQDMTPAQLEIAQGVTRERLMIVGDDKQGIYAYRGADSGALDRLKAELDAIELPLNTTYRCAKSIVRAAQRLVPDFEAGPDNPEGTVTYLDQELLTAEAQPGDFILSRVNAPLVSVAMSLLKQGKRARIAGKDIGKGLVTMVRKFKARSVPDLLSKISAWETREVIRLDAKFPAPGFDHSLFFFVVNGVLFAETNDDIGVVEKRQIFVIFFVDKRIALFTDDGLGDAGVITCSSVHKAKGLEARKVFVLADTLREHTQEEINITYVAITRAKEDLVYVVKKRDEEYEERQREEW